MNKISKKDDNFRIFLGVLFIFSLYFIFNWTSLGLNKENELTPENIIEKVGYLMVLPTDEKPTIATVSKENIIRENGFFEGSKIGDKVLIYARAKKAILYNPVSNKIINIAPLNIKSD